MTSLEELTADNERLKKELDAIAIRKAEKEQEDLKAKLEAQRKVDLEEHDKQLIAKVKAELGIGVQSKTPETTQQETNTGKSEWETYKGGYLERAKAKGLNVKGRTYIDLLQDMQRERAFQ